ncbi:MAG: DUF4249 family protein [Bacteroidota bacterium]
MRQLYFILPSFICVLMWSCVDQIDFSVPAGGSEDIAISGRLIKGDTSEVRVLISNIFDFSADGRRAITVRDPILRDDLGRSITLERTDLSEYGAVIPPDSDMPIEFGRAYSLEVSLFDGRRFVSAFETLLPSPPIAAANWSIVDQDVIGSDGSLQTNERISIQIDSDLIVSGERAGLLWELQRTWKLTDNSRDMRSCYIPENVSGSSVITLDATELQDGRLENYELLRLPVDPRLAQGTLIEVNQYSLTPSASDYWTNVDLLLSKTGNMFDAPSSRIGSNFSSIGDSTTNVFGYFFVTELQQSFIKIDSLDFGSLSTFCEAATPSAENPCPFSCCDCTEIPDISTTPPPNW